METVKHLKSTFYQRFCFMVTIWIFCEEWQPTHAQINQIQMQNNNHNQNQHSYFFLFICLCINSNVHHHLLSVWYLRAFIFQMLGATKQKHKQKIARSVYKILCMFIYRLLRIQKFLVNSVMLICDSYLSYAHNGSAFLICVFYFCLSNVGLYYYYFQFFSFDFQSAFSFFQMKKKTNNNSWMIFFPEGLYAYNFICTKASFYRNLFDFSPCFVCLCIC